MQNQEEAKKFIDQEIAKLKKEKENIIKKEQAKESRAIQLSKKLQILKEFRDNNEKEIIETQKKLNSLCTHEEIKTIVTHVEGGYLNQGEIISEDWCLFCGTRVDRRVQYTGFS